MIDRERTMATTYGFAVSDWQALRDWAQRKLQQVARGQQTIAYSDLTAAASRAGLVAPDPHSSATAGLLGQIALLEHEAKRPLLSAVVVHKSGDLAPGPGFWNFARELDMATSTGEHAELAFWSKELQRCHAYWRNH